MLTGRILVGCAVVAVIGATSCSDAYQAEGASCAPGMASCDSSSLDCETDVRSATAHCGVCGNVCPARANAFPLCRDGACAIGCNSGFGNCDGDDANGCESPLVADGKCRIACTGTLADCNADPIDGCEVETQTDPAHCGGCGKPCPPSYACANGSCLAPASCSALMAATPRPPSGVYRIDPDGAGSIPAFDAYCDLDPASDGGGWTLALKVDGTKKTFAYESAAWTNDATVAPEKPDFDKTEAKLLSYASMPVTALRVGLTDATGTTRWLVLTAAAPNLRSLLTNGYVATNVGRAKWIALVPAFNAQANCNREGFDVDTGQEDLRIGIAFNNEDSCTSPDSMIGVGIGNTANDQVVAGGFDLSQSHPAFAYVFIR